MSLPTLSPNRLSLGIDFGTSGVRAIVLDSHLTIQSHHSLVYDSLPNQNGWEAWQTALFAILEKIPAALRSQITSLAINGTSSTVLLCDPQGTPVMPPLLYNDDRGKAVLDRVQAIAPPHHPVLSATSSLAKLVWWIEAGFSTTSDRPLTLLHQADWLGFLLHGQLGVTDYHNALKLGYDVAALQYPEWLHPLTQVVTLPQVLAPGTPIAPLLPAIAHQFQFPPHCQVCAGTTDSIAAFLASGATHPGQAVTSLGSTLVLKLLSHTRVDDARYGIYSHRLGNLWLVGGASNTGGAVLRQFFSDGELQALSLQIPVDQPSPLDYYPLSKPGERFPINDPNLQPRLEPRPEDPGEFLRGLLEGIARIEAQGYTLLQELGATPLTQVYTAGGGASNLPWQAMRQRSLGVLIEPSPHTEAAYGTALLAQGRLGLAHLGHLAGETAAIST